MCFAAGGCDGDFSVGVVELCQVGVAPDEVSVVCDE